MAQGRTHIPKYHAEKCLACGGCTWACPAAVFKELGREQGSLRQILFTSRPYQGEAAAMPPCRMACPLGQDVPAYISAIAQEDLACAARIVRDTNALPSVCGRVCIASCMRACSRASIDEGVDIRALKRFAVAAARQIDAPKRTVEASAARVAVVGAGPAGLAAAHRLVQLGLRAVVFEAAQKAGGMLVDAIPKFVLPREMVAFDVGNLERMGVELRTSVSIGDDLKWSELERDFDAVLVATGAGYAVKPSIPGGDLRGAVSGLDFCRAAGQDKAEIKAKVVVQGGGHAALQAARTALRLGARSVVVIHAMPLDLWPAGPDAIRIAEEEGVSLLAEHRVAALLGPGKVETVSVRKVHMGQPDGVGRPTGLAGGKEEKIDADLFIAAAEGRRPARKNQPDLGGIARGVLGNLQVSGGYRLGRPGWYAAGEAATGAATVVDSMATARLAAEAIVRDLNQKEEARQCR